MLAASILVPAVATLVGIMYLCRLTLVLMLIVLSIYLREIKLEK